jgi:hypothetical protein
MFYTASANGGSLKRNCCSSWFSFFESNVAYSDIGAVPGALTFKLMI